MSMMLLPILLSGCIVPPYWDDGYGYGHGGRHHHGGHGHGGHRR